MDLAVRFHSAIEATWAQAAPRWEVLPTVLARACAIAVPVAGAGISLTHALRVPLGSSDDVAAQAELLQVTIGEGPCLTAASSQQPLVADLDQMADQWPLFHSQLVSATPFRSVASVPLRVDNQAPYGAFDLYSTEPAAVAFPDPARIEAEIATVASHALLAAPRTTELSGVEVPAWMDTQPTRRRMQVWVAIGILASRAQVDNRDALDLLRGFAFNHDLTLDDLADEVISGDRPIQSIWPAGRSG